MNTIINRKNRSKTFLIVSIAAISFVSASGCLSESASAQQADQRTLNGVTGTVVRVRLAPAPTPLQAKGVLRGPVQDLVEVGVQVADGEVYVAMAYRAHQPRLGASVMLVSAGNGLRIAE
ncbi:hypothetical protein P3T23_008067 [Paraburkholderia sp. GAS448]|uniref:hypothetical protein n=1 Tax=Paraburkholderia sp. GAS448 TaxID=3035136 RepID=UPI003D19610F